jgi:hypothetical protein
MDIRTKMPSFRIDRCKKHNLVDILLLCIIALVCGVESVEDIVFFGETHQAWLKKYLALPNGILSGDTILRVLGRIEHRKFEACFLSWTRGYFKEKVSAGLVIAVNGKTVRRSESDERKAIHIVSAWAESYAWFWDKYKPGEKSNEITAIQALLTTLTGVSAFAHSVRTHWGIENKLHWVRPFGRITRETGKTIRRRTWRYYEK